jgi:hypothetical protein
MRRLVIASALSIVCGGLGCKSEPEIVTPGPAGTGPGPTPSETGSGRDGGAGGSDAGTSSGGSDAGGAPDASAPSTGCDVVTAAGGLAFGSARGTTPSIAWGGASFGVAWQADAAGGGGIRFARMDRAGTPAGEVTLTSASTAVLPRVFADGGGFAVVWQEGSAPSLTMRLARLDASGAPKGAACELAKSEGDDARPVGAAAGGTTAGAWMTKTGAVIAPVGAACATQGKLLLDAASFPALAPCGDRIAAAYVRGARVLAAPLLDGATSLGAEVAVRDAAGAAHLPRVACGGSRTYVAWEDERSGLGSERVFVSGVGPDGAALPETEVPSAPGSANWPDVAATGAGLAVAYYQFRAGPPAVYLTAFGAGLGRVGDDLKLSGDAGAKYPSVAWSGDELAIVWVDLVGPLRVAIAHCH